MFFPECDSIVREHRDLADIVERIDCQIATFCSPAILRPLDFACALGGDENQIVSVFELLAARGVLSAEEMVECERCNNLMPASVFRQAIRDGVSGLHP